MGSMTHSHTCARSEPPVWCVEMKNANINMSAIRVDSHNWIQSVVTNCVLTKKTNFTQNIYPKWNSFCFCSPLVSATPGTPSDFGIDLILFFNLLFSDFLLQFWPYRCPLQPRLGSTRRNATPATRDQRAISAARSCMNQFAAMTAPNTNPLATHVWWKSTTAKSNQRAKVSVCNRQFVMRSMDRRG